MFGIFVQYSTRPICDVSMNVFCWPPSVDIFNILPGFLWQPLLRTLKRKDYIKYLGILLDSASNLSWKYHIDFVASKITKTIWIIARLRHYVPLYTLLNLYRSLISPHLSYVYGMVLWGPISIYTTYLCYRIVLFV